MRETGFIWVMLAAMAVAVSVAVIKTAEVQKDQNRSLHSIICFVQFREEETLIGRPRAQALAFWKAALARGGLPPCAPAVPARTTTTTR